MGQNVKNKVDKRTIAIDLKYYIVHQVNSIISFGLLTILLIWFR